MSDQYEVAVLVRGIVPADSAEEALRFISEEIRRGLGPDTGHRPFDIAIAAGMAKKKGERPEVRINTEMLRRLGEERTE